MNIPNSAYFLKQQNLLHKRGNSYDITKDKTKHLVLDDKPQLSSLITQLQKKQTAMTPITPKHQNHYLPVQNERMFSLSPSRTNIEPLLPPKHMKYQHKKTLVLDLDETLVHSDFEPFNPSDIILSIEFENMIHDIHVLVRPGTIEFIKHMGELYEVIIFTASLSKYADPLMDILDENQVCAFRLFREHCTFINGVYVKDLKRLNRNLKDVIIVDNSPLSFTFHPENGLPILSWYNEKDDEELYKITPLLEFLSIVNDVRKFIPKIVYNKTISYTSAQNVIDSYYRKRKPIHNEVLNDSQSYQKHLNKSNSGTNSKLKKSFDDNKDKDFNMKIISSSKQTSSKNAPSKNRNAFRNGNISNIIKDLNINNSRSNKHNTNNKHRHNNNKNNNNSINTNNNSNDNTFTMYKPMEQQLKMIPHVANTKNKITSFQPVTNSTTVICSTKHRPSTSSTSFSGNTNHKRENSLNVGKEPKFILNSIIYRSPSSQAIVVSSTTTHKNNNLKISLNKQTPTNAKCSSGFNIHAISLYGSKNGIGRPKSSEHGNLSVQLQLKDYVPKTPKLQGNCQNRLLKSGGVQGKQGSGIGMGGNYEGNRKFIPIEEVFVKKRFSNTSRHIDNPNKINLNNPWLVGNGNGKKG